jgi:hypothetical protein
VGGFVPVLLSFHRAMAAFLIVRGNYHATPVAAQGHAAIARNVTARTNSFVKRKLPVQLQPGTVLIAPFPRRSNPRTIGQCIASPIN